MNFIKTTIADGCLTKQFEASQRIKTRRARRDGTRGSTLKANLATRRQYTRRQITELLFESCIDCERMSAVPQGAFAAIKVRENMDKKNAASTSAMKTENKEDTEKKRFISYPKTPQEGWELTLLKYNSKLMNSIWGQYNRYSVHNFKKNTDAEKGARGGVAAAIWSAILEKHPPVANAAATATAKAPQIMKAGNSF
ncbi:uncharacterized protein LOC105424717 [Pogonomyrmex barbatus]|uniref:Uncharacterized protein LOC105424717 n=1 Tax=Pogonomyrmex barbatus TaxID=144034 RepID=A0A6I9W106_9HYME|nr:uncharacterized protein LOC105424717 [Pogonomyrmex barbatus]